MPSNKIFLSFHRTRQHGKPAKHEVIFNTIQLADGLHMRSWHSTESPRTDLLSYSHFAWRSLNGRKCGLHFTQQHFIAHDREMIRIDLGRG